MQTGLSIQKANVNDAALIARVHVQSWRETYHHVLSESYLAKLSIPPKTTMWEKLLSDRDHTTFTAVFEGEFIGFINGGPARESEHKIDGELYAFYLLRKFQKQGFGRKLFLEFVRELKNQSYDNFYIWVLEKNPARGFYKKLGCKYLKSANLSLDDRDLVEEMYLCEIE